MKPTTAQKIFILARAYLRRAERRRQRIILRRQEAVRCIERVWLTLSQRRRTLRIVSDIARQARIRSIMLVFISKCLFKVKRRKYKRLSAVRKLQFHFRKYLFGSPFAQLRTSPSVQSGDDQTDTVAFLQAMASQAVKTGQRLAHIGAVTRIQAVYRGHRVRLIYTPMIRELRRQRLAELDKELLSGLRKKYYSDIGYLLTKVSPPRVESIGRAVSGAALAADAIRAQVSFQPKFLTLDDLDKEDAHSDVSVVSSLASIRNAYIRPTFPPRIKNPSTKFAMTRRWACREGLADAFTLRQHVTEHVVRAKWVSTVTLSKIDESDRSAVTRANLKHFCSGSGSRVRTPSERSEVPSVIRTHTRKQTERRETERRITERHTKENRRYGR